MSFFSISDEPYITQIMGIKFNPTGPVSGSVIRYSATGNQWDFPTLSNLSAAGNTGPTGAAGADSNNVGSMGPTGPMGVPGSATHTGATGPAGTTGPSGPMGVPGSATHTGATGPDGSTGPIGNPGSATHTGATGPGGATGSVGIPGSATHTGATGPTGPGGAAGLVGEMGPTGALGTTGPVTDSSVVLFDGTAGVAVKSSEIIVSGTNNQTMSNVHQLILTNSTLQPNTGLKCRIYMEDQSTTQQTDDHDYVLPTNSPGSVFDSSTNNCHLPSQWRLVPKRVVKTAGSPQQDKMELEWLFFGDILQWNCIVDGDPTNSNLSVPAQFGGGATYSATQAVGFDSVQLYNISGSYFGFSMLPATMNFQRDFELTFSILMGDLNNSALAFLVSVGGGTLQNTANVSGSSGQGTFGFQVLSDLGSGFDLPTQVTSYFQGNQVRETSWADSSRGNGYRTYKLRVTTCYGQNVPIRKALFSTVAGISPVLPPATAGTPYNINSTVLNALNITGWQSQAQLQTPSSVGGYITFQVMSGLTAGNDISVNNVTCRYI